MKSIWSDIDIPKRNPLPGDCHTQVAVIGGGMAGILIAYYLQRQGKQVIVLEADRIGGGQTLGTTAKITSQHNLIYQRLISNQGMKQARQYADANQAAIGEYERLIWEKSISCDFQPFPAYLYSVNDGKSLQREAEAARKLGIDASFISQTELPFKVKGALRFAGQAQFNPRKFLQSLSSLLTIYERTKVLAVKGNRVFTNHGMVTAKAVVFACHYPFVNLPGLYFARMYQQRSYVLALEHTPSLHGMYLGIEKEGLSLRQSGEHLLLGGRGHRTGQVPSTNPYQSLSKAAKHFFPDCRVVAHWSAQDCMSIDGIPYIGRFAPSTPDWYVATGFGKWGMSSSMVAAIIISDMICGKINPWAEVFSPQRLNLKGTLSETFSHIGESVKGLTLGASKSALRCPHLGCKLTWNPTESTWECPCHGSRFQHNGQLLNGPAQNSIKL